MLMNQENQSVQGGILSLLHSTHPLSGKEEICSKPTNGSARPRGEVLRETPVDGSWHGIRMESDTSLAFLWNMKESDTSLALLWNMKGIRHHSPFFCHWCVTLGQCSPEDMPPVHDTAVPDCVVIICFDLSSSLIVKNLEDDRTKMISSASVPWESEAEHPSFHAAHQADNKWSCVP